MSKVTGLDLSVLSHVAENTPNAVLRDKILKQVRRINKVHRYFSGTEVYFRARILYWELWRTSELFEAPLESFNLARLRFKTSSGKTLTATVGGFRGHISNIDYSSETKSLKNDTVRDVLELKFFGLEPLSTKEIELGNQSVMLSSHLGLPDGQNAIVKSEPYDEPSLVRLLEQISRVPADTKEVYSIANGFELGDWMFRKLEDFSSVTVRNRNFTVIADGPEATFLVFHPKNGGELFVVDHEETKLEAVGKDFQEATSNLALRSRTPAD